MRDLQWTIGVVATLCLTQGSGVSGTNSTRRDVLAQDPAPLISFEQQKVALLVAVPQHTEIGLEAVRKWSTYAGIFGDELPPVSVVCATGADAGSLRAEGLQDLVTPLVLEKLSWAAVLENFMEEQGANVLGLFAEGSYPPHDLVDSVRHVGPALAEVETPAVIISRSRSQKDSAWLPDTFVAQAWLTRDTLAAIRRMPSALTHQEAQSLPLLGALQVLVRYTRMHIEGLLVDGTNIAGSSVAVGPTVHESATGEALPVATDSRGEKVYIGTLPLALVRSEDGAQTVEIVRAPWPPRYVLEHTATEQGVVIVSNVNCGYLDMSVNFMLSVQRQSGAKVLFVAMDEVSFDFLDDLEPGTVAMFPVKAGSVRKHASKAGEFGDASFAAEVLVRPSILSHILAQKFTVLWSDSDVVWLGNPLPLLPDTKDPYDSEVMLQHDGSDEMACTCFMFLKPTVRSHKLLALWKKNMIDKKSDKNQIPFQAPLKAMVDIGLNVEFIPDEVMPHGRGFFDAGVVDDYAKVVHPEARIAHNNFIKGHEKKMGRFQRYKLWWVEGMHFPECDGA